MLSSSIRDGLSTYRDFIDEEGRQLTLQFFIKRNHLSHLGKEELVTVTPPLILPVKLDYVTT